MAISFVFAFNLMLSSRSFSVKFPMVMSWIFISWFFGRIRLPVAGFVFSISLLMLVSHGDSVVFPVCWSYCTMLCSRSSFKIFSNCSIGISRFFASCLMSWVFCSSIIDSMSVVLNMFLRLICLLLRVRNWASSSFLAFSRTKLFLL